MPDTAKTVRERIGPRFGLTEDGCWKPFASPSKDGYVHLRFDGKQQQLHRITYQLIYGEIPAGVHAHHTCSNKWCCNPDHIELLSPRDHKKFHPVTSLSGRNR